MEFTFFWTKTIQLISKFNIDYVPGDGVVVIIGVGVTEKKLKKDIAWNYTPKFQWGSISLRKGVNFHDWNEILYMTLRNDLPVGPIHLPVLTEISSIAISLRNSDPLVAKNDS